MQELVRNTYKNDIIFVDGFAKSGKVIVEKVLECFKNVENHSEIDELETIIDFHKMGKISKDSASILLQMRLDREVYNLNISRNLNIRFKDDSSIFKYPYPFKYLKRLYSNNRETTDMDIDSNKSILNIAIHDAITNANLLFDIFGYRSKIISVIRNPIDITCGIYKYNIFDRMFSSPSTTYIHYKVVIDNKEYIIPYFAMKWKEDYVTMTAMERILKWYYESMKSDLNAYEKLSKERKKKILIIDFDKLVTNPIDVCSKIEKLIHSEPQKKLRRVLKKQDCPRGIESRWDNQKFILSNVHHSKRELFDNCMNIYNKLNKYERN